MSATSKSGEAASLSLRFNSVCLQLLVVAWAGMIWSIGYLAVPLLFRVMESRVEAGRVAGALFEGAAWVGLALGGMLLLLLLLRSGKAAGRMLAFWLVVLLLVIHAVNLFGIQPFMAQMKQEALPLDVMASALRERFMIWHGISSSLYLLQSGLALILALKIPPRLVRGGSSAY